MPWVITDRLELDAAASAWFIRRFIDRDACLHFCPPDTVARVARGGAGRAIGAPGAAPAFPLLAREHRPEDVALARLARVVRCACEAGAREMVAEAAGLRAIGRGFPLVGRGEEIVHRSAFLYDALYAAFQAEPPVETRAARDARALAWFWLR